MHLNSHNVEHFFECSSFTAKIRPLFWTWFILIDIKTYKFEIVSDKMVFFHLLVEYYLFAFVQNNSFKIETIAIRSSTKTSAVYKPAFQATS